MPATNGVNSKNVCISTQCRKQYYTTIRYIILLNY